MIYKTKKKGKLDIEKLSEDVSEFEQKQRKSLFNFLNQENIWMQALSINLENLNGQQLKYLMYLSIINCITLSKMIRDNQIHWELKRYPIKQKKNALNLLRMIATCYQKNFCYFQRQNFG